MAALKAGELPDVSEVSPIGIDGLRALSAFLTQLPDGGCPAGQWYMKGFAQYQAARGGITLDAVFGLLPGTGREPWWAIEDRAQRDKLLHDMAADCFPDNASRHQKAVELAAGLLRYETSSWRQDRKFTEPPRSCSRLRELQYRILKCCGGRAPSARTVERVLASSPAPPLPRG